MESESLRKLRTMRQVRTGLALARLHKARTSNSLAKPEEPESKPHDPSVERILTKERGRMAAYEASVARSRRRLLDLRENLALVISRNRALTELRYELQESRWHGKEPVPDKPAAPGIFRGIEFRY